MVDDGFRTIWLKPDDPQIVQIIDQRRLPHDYRILELRSWQAGAEAIRDMAVRAFRALEGSGLARVDFLVGEDGRPRFLEINTLPGFTSHSLVPLAAKDAGMEPADVVEALLNDAVVAA